MKLAGRNNNKIDGLDKVFGLVAAAALFFIAYIFWPVSIGGGKNATRRTAAVYNAKQIVLAMEVYAKDWDEKLPPASNWESSIRKYVKTELVFTLPIPPNYPAHRFAFNAPMSGVNLSGLENLDSTVLVFETDSPTESAVGGQEMVRAFPESKVAVIAFGDMHVKLQLVSDIGGLHWKPAFRRSGKERVTK